MKKILLVVALIFLLVGCTDMMNTPTKKVEEFLNKYQTLHDDVLSQLDSTLEKDTSMSDIQKKDYKELMKNQYKNLMYKIKDETIDGDNATVEVEIEVYDYNKSIKDSEKYLTDNNDKFVDENGNLKDEKFVDYKLEQLKKVKDKVTYTLALTLTKVDDKWKMDDITETDRQKIHGIYDY